jgi:hypothetical protein
MQIDEELMDFNERLGKLLGMGLGELGEHIVIEQAKAGGEIATFLSVEALSQLDQDALSPSHGSAASENVASLEEDLCLLYSLDCTLV